VASGISFDPLSVSSVVNPSFQQPATLSLADGVDAPPVGPVSTRPAVMRRCVPRV
jgi:hypothetical protein